MEQNYKNKFNKKREENSAENERVDRYNEERQKDLIIGRNAVTELIKSGREIDTLYIVRGEKGGSVGKIIGECREKGAVVKEVDRKKLDFMCGHANHQGVAAICAAHDYATVEEILAVAEDRGEAPFIVVCDGIEDPHNLGAIIRTAEAAGVHGIIIPKRRSASLNYTVGKTSAGALEYMKVARVSNLASTLDDLKERGMWVYGADMGGQDIRKTNLDGATVLVIGSEGDGMSRIVREKCDFIVSLPMKGQINSLNASVAGGILMYEFSYARNK